MTQEKALTILKSGENVFLTGEPGSGKSYTVNKFRDWMKSMGHTHAVTASTGIAATHIGGVTIHSWSGIGIKDIILSKDVDNINYNKPYLANKIKAVRTLIIDEVSMLDANTIDNIDFILRGVRDTEEPFGGIQMVFVGDFYQLPPVSKEKEKMKFAFESFAWKRSNPSVCYLHEQHRQTDGEFTEILKAMRNGEVKPKHKKTLLSSGKKAKQGEIKTRLFTHNADVDKINNEKLGEIDGPTGTFKMTSAGNEYLVETLKKNCLSPETLKLKVGATVMFTKNKYDDEGVIYVNGTLGIVTQMCDEEFAEEIEVTTKDGDKILLDRETWSIEDHYGEVQASISQYPLKLAWAITIHKSQGMSLDAADIDLSKAFEYGQGYVAISRVRSLEGLYIDGLNVKALEMHPKVVEQDIIFREDSNLTDLKY
jgi:ATP-dependent DNA helicase PIF1